MKLTGLEAAEKWKQRTSGELYIKEEAHFRHSDLFLENYTDIKDAIISVLNGPLVDQEFSYRYKNLKNPYYKLRIKAHPLNKGIRSRFKESELEFKYEVTFEEGFFDNTLQTAGFDFAHFDNQYNLANFRNLCFGRRAFSGGKELWEEKLSNNSLWRDLSNQMNIHQIPTGTDMEFKKQTPTVLGEIQFGNWALVYRDILKVIQIERDEDVDLFIYIAAAGNLASAISGGTVNFEDTKKIFQQYKNTLTMPIWLIGVDVR